MDFLNNLMLKQARDAVKSATQAADDAQRVSSTTRGVVEGLELQVERLTLLVVALSELVTEHGVCTEAQLRERVEAVDLRDGKADGRITPQAASCPHCGRVKSAVRARCVWCGTETTPLLPHRPSAG